MPSKSSPVAGMKADRGELYGKLGLPTGLEEKKLLSSWKWAGEALLHVMVNNMSLFASRSFFGPLQPAVAC